MTAIAIIQARMSSERLPGKVLLPLAGKPMIWHIVERVKASQQVNDVVVATSNERSDDALVDVCRSFGIKVHRGSLTDVMSRYVEILGVNFHDYVVRITGDCPLVDPHYVDQQLTVLQQFDGDYTWLKYDAPVLEGQGVLSAKALLHIAKHSTHPDDREHVGSRYMVEHPELFKIVGLNPPPELIGAQYRITVDENRDYEVLSRLYEELWTGDPIPLVDAIAWLDRNPSAAKINAAIQHSAVNKELIAKRAAWKKHVVKYSDW